MIDKHDWHWLTDYCTRCGVALYQQVDAPRPCTRDPNVVAISHLVCGGPLRGLAGKVLDKMR